MVNSHSEARFTRFFEDSFDVSQYIRELLAASSHTDTLHQGADSSHTAGSQDLKTPLETSSSGEVAKAVSELGGVIRGQVVLYKKPLLQQALHVLHLEKWLHHIRSNVAQFQAHFLQVRQDLREPFDALRQQGSQISKAHKILRMMRSIHLFVVLVTRLKRLLRPSTSSDTDTATSSTAATESVANEQKTIPTIDLSQTASLVHDLLVLVDKERLSGIQVIDNEIPWVTQLKQVLQDRAKEWFTKLSPPATTFTSRKPATSTTSSSKSTATLDTTILAMVHVPTLTDAVTVLFTLDTLDTVVVEVLENRRAATSLAIQSALDITLLKTTTPIPSSTSASGTSASSLVEQRRVALWTQLEALFREVLPAHLDCLMTLHRTLSILWKKRQHGGHEGSDSFVSRSALTSDASDPSAASDPLISSEASAVGGTSLPTFLKSIFAKAPKNSSALSALTSAVDQSSLVKYVWCEIVETELCDSAIKAAHKAKLIEQILSTDFPRFLRLFHAFSEHAATQLERSGFDFASIVRTMHLANADTHSDRNAATISSTSKSLGQTSIATDSGQTTQNSSGKIYHFLHLPNASSLSAHDDSKLYTAADAQSRSHSSISASKMELLIGLQLWTKLSGKLQFIETEYQKMLVTQFFTPINGMFAVGTNTTSASNTSSDPASAEKWSMFGSLGSTGKAAQKGGVYVGGRLLLPGEVILALSNRADTTGGSGHSVGGRWLGGSHYLCKWLELVKTHFDALQGTSPTLIRTLLPKYLLALNKSIKLLVLKTEEVISHEEEASQVVDLPPISQRFNMAVYNAMASVYTFIHKYVYSKIQSQWSAEAGPKDMNDLSSVLASICALAQQHLVQPIFHRTGKLVSKCIFVDLHQTDWSVSSKTTTPSLWLRTLQRVISHLLSSILPSFTSTIFFPSPSAHEKSILDAQTSQLASTMAQEFLHSVALIRHLSDPIKLRIVSDVSQVEQLCQSLEQACLSPNSLSTTPSTANTEDSHGLSSRSETSRQLSGFRDLIFAETSSIIEAVSSALALALSSSSSSSPPSAMTTAVSDAEEETVSAHSAPNQKLRDSVIILHPAITWHVVLLRAPAPEALSPHAQLNSSIRQYVDWVLHASHSQVLARIQASITNAKKAVSTPEPAFDALDTLGPSLLALHGHVSTL